MRLVLLLVLLLIPALCRAQAVGTLLAGQGAGTSPLYTPNPSVAGTLSFTSTAGNTHIQLPGGSLSTWSTLANNFNLAGGAHPASASWKADASAATIISGNGSAINFYMDTGLSVASSYTPTQRISMAPIGTSTAYGLNIQNNTTTSLQWGDGFLTSVGAGNMNLTAGVYYNGSQWLATDSYSTYNLMNIIGNQLMGFYSGGASTVGNPVTWTMQQYIDFNGVHVGHMYGNVTGFAPSVTNGTLYTNASDTFGYINASAWPVTLTFGKAFAGSAACVANTAAGLAGVMYTGSNLSTSIQFGCVNYVGGATCAAGWFAYHCFDVGP